MNLTTTTKVNFCPRCNVLFKGGNRTQTNVTFDDSQDETAFPGLLIHSGYRGVFKDSVIICFHTHLV